MINEKIAEMFYEMADIYEIQEVQWKPRAYRMAARSIEGLTFDLQYLYKKGGIKALEEIPGIGVNLANKIIEYIKTGHIKEYEKLTKGIPSGLKKIMDIPGMGPKRSYILFKKLKIKSVADLKKAIAEHKIRRLKGFGEISEENIEKSLGLKKAHKNRWPLKFALSSANKIVNELKKLRAVERIIVAGSLRRKEETIGDIDILVISKKPVVVMDRFTTLPYVKRVIAKGPTKSEVVLKNGMQADVRVVESKSFGAALQYFTGNKQHNIALRRIAKKKGYKLSEYGLFKDSKIIAGSTEEEIYNKLGLRYIKPEERKNQGEIERAKF